MKLATNIRVVEDSQSFQKQWDKFMEIKIHQVLHLETKLTAENLRE